MADIIGAIEKEKEYLSFRMKGEEPYHFVDAVKEFGFESLEEYFEAKRDYEFSQLEFEVIETTPEKAISDVLATIAAKKTAVLFANTEETLIWNGNNSEFNVEYCNECGIPIYPLYTGGGTIVCTAGDLEIGICVPSESKVDSSYLLGKIADIFKKYTGKAVEVSGNDILVDGYKVLGSATYRQYEFFSLIAPLSFSDKSELIEKICTKHSVKQPGYIDFMTREDFRREVLEWLGATLY